MPVDPNCADVWRWRVHYRDGDTLEEYDEDGTDHGFAEVQLAEVVALEVYPAAGADSPLAQQIVLIDAESGQRPIFFRRRQQLLMLDNATGEIDERAPRRTMTATVIGWQRTVRRKNVAHFCALFDDGSSFATDSREMLNQQLHLIASGVFQQAVNTENAPPVEIVP